MSENTPSDVRLPVDLNPRDDPPLDFPQRDLGEMTPQDYDALGFMCGLEVHQQLVTSSKLFCRCPAGRSVAAFDAEVLRHMRPTLSELGEYDGTALMEFKTRKDIVYRLERGSVCTYEMDDTPPFELDEEAIRVALNLCLMFDLNVVSELHVMRKQYLDGSIPTGFQRTIMMGLAGAVPFRVKELGVDKPLRIRQLSLEEDSCREVSDIGHRITFRTDRLGMPLTEVVTEPDLLTPWEVQAGARLVASATRAIGRVRRGPGAARQDVNVSIAGGRRVEIKGVHHQRGLPRLVHIEAFRQLNLLRIRQELHQRGVTHESLVIPGGIPWEVSSLVADVTSALKSSDYTPLRETLQHTGEPRDSLQRRQDDRRRAARDRTGAGMACAVRLPGFAGVLARPTQPGVTFANELADRVRVIACLTARPFMIHSDIKGYGLSNAEWRQVRSTLRAERGDSVVVVWGPRDDCATAAREIFLRAAEALDGIPSETRQAYVDGTNGFERILPGPDRMYPDTDTPPLPIPDAWIETARVGLAESPWARAARYRELGLKESDAARLADAPWADLYDEVIQLVRSTEAGQSKRKPRALAADFVAAARRLFHAFEKQLPRFLRRSTGSRRSAWRTSTNDERQSALPSAAPFAALANAFLRGKLRLEGVELGVARVLSQPEALPETHITAFQPQASDTQQVDALVRECVQSVPDHLRVAKGGALLRWAMGEVMPHVRGRVDANELCARLTNELRPNAQVNKAGHE